MTSILRLIRSAMAVAVLSLPGTSGRGEDAGPFEQVTPASHELAAGELMPDVRLRGSDGGEIWLRDFRGKAVAITFFYSRCTAATFCPLTGRKFDTAQSLLARMNAVGRCHLLSISLDPARDTPEILLAYSKGYQADAGLWTFVTGTESDIQKLGDAVGLEYRRNGDQIDHNLRTVVLDASGHIRRIFRGDNWTPQELVAELNATARQYR